MWETQLRYISNRNQSAGIYVMMFSDTLACLREEIRTRIRNGDLTERALARRVGLSQTHIHNVMKGAREMTPEVADVLLGELGISLTDLVERVRTSKIRSKGPGREQRTFQQTVAGRERSG